MRRDSTTTPNNGKSPDLHELLRQRVSPLRPEGRKRGRTKEELAEVICWLPGYGAKASAGQIKRKTNLATFFNEAASLHPNVSTITGVISGVRTEEIENPLMRKIRYLDKLVDELAKGRPVEKMRRK